MAAAGARMRLVAPISAYAHWTVLKLVTCFVASQVDCFVCMANSWE